jgi:hypothetical protein
MPKEIIFEYGGKEYTVEVPDGLSDADLQKQLMEVVGGHSSTPLPTDANALLSQQGLSAAPPDPVRGLQQSPRNVLIPQNINPAIAKAQQTVPRAAMPGGDLGPTFSGLMRAGTGVQKAVQNPSLNSILGAGSDILRGGAEASMQLLPAAGVPIYQAMLRNPGKTLGTGAVAGTAQAGVEGGAKALGAGEGTAAFTGDLAGILGGAGVLRGIPAAKQLINNRVENVEPVQALTQALKPKNTMLRFRESAEIALPELKAAERELGKPIESADDLLAAVKIAKKQVWSNIEQVSKGAGTVNLKAMAKELRAAGLEEEAAAANELARKYKTETMPFSKLEENLETLNAKLDSYYAKFPNARATAATANPDTAADTAEANALRTVINRTLDPASGGAVPKDAKRRYGALRDLEKAAESRINVAARQAPESLSEQLSGIRAVGKGVRGLAKVGSSIFTGSGQGLSGLADIVDAVGGRWAGKALKEANKTDTLIRRALKNFSGEPEPLNFTGPAASNTPGPIGPPNTPATPGTIWEPLLKTAQEREAQLAAQQQQDALRRLGTKFDESASGNILMPKTRTAEELKAQQSKALAKKLGAYTGADEVPGTVMQAKQRSAEELQQKKTKELAKKLGAYSGAENRPGTVIQPSLLSAEDLKTKKEKEQITELLDKLGLFKSKGTKRR